MMIHGITNPFWVLILTVSGICSMNFNIFNAISHQQPTEGDVKLVGSKTTSEGRVEIYHDGKWGTVCDDGWDLTEAQVVCRQLHFLGAKSAVIGGAFGEGSGTIWLDDLECKGSENSLSNCGFKDWAVSDCSHKEDAGVICESGSNFTISDTKHVLDHSRSLSGELGQLFDSGEGCDFLIIVQSATGNILANETFEMAVTTVCAHKIILSRFPGFNASDGVSNTSVHLSQACQPYFASFIRYIYTRKTDVTVSSAQCLHSMASEFGVKQLMEDTGRLFSKLLPEDVTFHTQASLYEYSVKTGDLLLQENCLQFLAWNYQNFTRSPAWKYASLKLLKGLLSRSDVVVPDESFLLRSVESWISKMGNSISLESQADLLRRIRFPMISAEDLYELPSTSALYQIHESLYRDKIMKGFQFNILLASTLNKNSSFRENNDYQPRIYTGEPWSVAIDTKQTQIQNTRSRQNYGQQYNYMHQYPYGSQQIIVRSFSTPVHNSLIFKNNMINWEANIFLTKQECLNRGLICESIPATRLSYQNGLSKNQGHINYSNRLLLLCEGKFICQVQDFKNNLAQVPANDSQALAYPCPKHQYIYRFVVRPEYI